MKKAFTLIELIITIVIIGIAASALPTMIASANKLEEETINQDVFFKSITVVTDIASRYWDGSIATKDRDGEGVMLADTSTSDINLSRVSPASQFRVGYFGRTENDFRKFYDSASPAQASSIPTTSGAINPATATAEEFDSIEKYNNKFIDETTAAAKVRYDVKVEYVSDTATVDATDPKHVTATWKLNGSAVANSTNLKRITVTASGRTVAGQPMSINFVYFSSNIGTPGIKKQ